MTHWIIVVVIPARNGAPSGIQWHHVEGGTWLEAVHATTRDSALVGWTLAQTLPYDPEVGSVDDTVHGWIRSHVGTGALIAAGL